MIPADAGGCHERMHGLARYFPEQPEKMIFAEPRDPRQPLEIRIAPAGFPDMVLDGADCALYKSGLAGVARTAKAGAQDVNQQDRQETRKAGALQGRGQAGLLFLRPAAVRPDTDFRIAFEITKAVPPGDFAHAHGQEARGDMVGNQAYPEVDARRPEGRVAALVHLPGFEKEERSGPAPDEVTARAVTAPAGKNNHDFPEGMAVGVVLQPGGISRPAGRLPLPANERVHEAPRCRPAQHLLKFGKEFFFQRV